MKKILMTTADFPGPYEVIDIITFHKRLTQPRIYDKIVIRRVNAALREEADVLGADAVVGIGYSIERTERGASILGYGTAVKFVVQRSAFNVQR